MHTVVIFLNLKYNKKKEGEKKRTRKEKHDLNTFPTFLALIMSKQI